MGPRTLQQWKNLLCNCPSVSWVCPPGGYMVGLMVTSSGGGLSHMLCLPVLLLPELLSPQQAIANLGLCKETFKHHRQVWPGPVGVTAPLPWVLVCTSFCLCLQESLWVWGLILTWLHLSYLLVVTSPLSLDVRYLFYFGGFDMAVQQLCLHRRRWAQLLLPAPLDLRGQTQSERHSLRRICSQDLWKRSKFQDHQVSQQARQSCWFSASPIKRTENQESKV